MKYNTFMSIKEKINDNMNAPATSHISDTPPHIQEILTAGYRRMSPQKKLKRVSELTKAVQQLALARIRQQYGRLSEREQRLRLASLWLDRETMIKVFNWDPSVKGY
jgi:N-glycosylase/DNA lyase